MPRNSRQCDRRDGKLAKASLEVAYEGVTYQLQLCRGHQQEAIRSIGTWTRLAEEITEETVETPLIGECQRCPWTAKVRKHVGLDGEDFLLQLCDKHADLLIVDMFSWIRQGREISDQMIPRVIRLTTGPIVESNLEPARVPVESESEPEPDFPAASHEWRLTRHARERLQERGPVFGFTALDVMLACVHPEIRTASAEKAGVWLYRRGPVIVTLNPEIKMVLTVGPNTPGKRYDNANELQEA